VIRYITGSEFDTVFGDISPNLREGVETEDMVKIIGRLKNGAIFSIDPSYANNEHRAKVRVGVKNPKPVEIIDSNGLNPDIAIVTDGFHQLRAHLIAQKQHIPGKIGTVCADTEWIFVPTYTVREWLALPTLLFK
jgi:hypothetical protein